MRTHRDVTSLLQEVPCSGLETSVRGLSCPRGRNAKDASCRGGKIYDNCCKRKNMENIVVIAPLYVCPS